ncbi:MAG: FAD-dependent oxidoreductase [Clostridia bacterium]
MKKIRVTGVNLPLNYNKDDIIRAVSKKIGAPKSMILNCEISKKAIDARRKDDIKYVLNIDVAVKEHTEIKDKNAKEINDVDYIVKKYKAPKVPPVVVGFGPAGMFAALILAQSGFNPIVIERGKSVENRAKDTENFWKNRILNEESNVQFGEGGAGTFSDGKLNTGIKDQRIKKVLTEFVKAGAPKEILYEAKPHIGTDKLPNTVKNIREQIKALGGQVLFETLMSDIKIVNDEIKAITVLNKGQEQVIDCNNLILATGHSARDSFKMLNDKSVAMQAKPFSIGARIEHKAENINKSQYGKFYDKLPTADYKLAVHLLNGRGVYTFCMCPGGTVVGATSVKNAVVTNGMSEFARDKVNSNSAVLVGVTEKDFGDGVLDGIKFQEELEKKAFIMAGSNYNAPAQRLEDFMKNRKTKAFSSILPSYQPAVSACDLNKLFPDYVSQSLKFGINEMNKRLSGFACADAVLTAPETRSSSPVRILRDENLQSINVKGLYPCGEGAGYAGGITSAAVDGIKCAEVLINTYKY